MSNPLPMHLAEFLDSLETIEGMETPFKSIMRCYDGETPTLRLYHGEKLLATTNLKEAKTNPNLIHAYDVGYWMLHVIKQRGVPLSIQEAEELGEWRFSTAYTRIEYSMDRLVEVGVAIREGWYIPREGQRYARFNLGDLSQYFVTYRPPINDTNRFFGVVNSLGLARQ